MFNPWWRAKSNPILNTKGDHLLHIFVLKEDCVVLDEFGVSFSFIRLTKPSKMRFEF